MTKIGIGMSEKGNISGNNLRFKKNETTLPQFKELSNNVELDHS